MRDISLLKKNRLVHQNLLIAIAVDPGGPEQPGGFADFPKCLLFRPCSPASGHLADPRYIQSLRQPRIEAFKWVFPQDELDERIYREVLTDGCSILSFASSPTSPEFTYSVGLYLNFQHPELLLMGLHPDTAHEIIAKVRDEAAQGLMLTPDSVRHDLFDDSRPVRFRTVPQDKVSRLPWPQL